MLNNYLNLKYLDREHYAYYSLKNHVNLGNI